MTPSELLDIIAARHIEISPVLNCDGSIHHWSAGFKTKSPYGKGLVLTDGFASGPTIEESVRKLLAGETVFRWSEGGYELREENQ